MTTSNKLREEDLPRAAGAAVERALAARQTLTELRPEELDLVGGAGGIRMNMNMQVQTTLAIRPGDWVGPLLAPGAFQNPAVNAGAIQRQF